ncbi:MAG: ATP-binding cassette domain-containing protein [Burkholderiaceae bacterium]
MAEVLAGPTRARCFFLAHRMSAPSPTDSSAPVPSILIHGVDKHFGRQQVLHGVGFSIGRGEIVGLLGPNGSGKTTTLRIIAGFLGADAGEVSVGGVDLRANAIEARRQIGYLPERPPLYDTLTVRQYLAFAAGAKGIAPRARRAAIAGRWRLCAWRGARQAHRPAVQGLQATGGAGAGDPEPACRAAARRGHQRAGSAADH